MIILRVAQHLPTDDAPSACLHSWNFYCRCCVLDEWPTSKTASSSRTQTAPFHRKHSFNAQQTRMGDICEVGTRIQFVIDSPHSIDLTPCLDSDIIHVNALGTSMVILNSYKVAADLLDERSTIYSSR